MRLGTPACHKIMQKPAMSDEVRREVARLAKKSSMSFLRQGKTKFSPNLLFKVIQNVELWRPDTKIKVS